MFENVPKEINDELNTLGLEVGGTIGDSKEIHVVLTRWFPQKGNSNLIRMLELQGWTKEQGRMAGGTKQLQYRKEINPRFCQTKMNLSEV
jgi:hypothetical protein